MEILPVEQPRIFGFETEFGIHPMPPIQVKSAFDIYYINQQQVRLALPPNLTTIENGKGMTEIGRIYADMGKNVEFASPELLSLKGLTATYMAAEEVVEGIVDRIYADEVAEDGLPLRSAVKRAVDSDFNTRGDHENYFIGTSFSHAHASLVRTHLACRPILTGCGYMTTTDEGEYAYVIDQRSYRPDSKADEKYMAKTFYKQLSEDFPAADNRGRIEITSGSHNRFAYPIAARIFNTSSVLRLIEWGAYPEHLQAADPFEASRITARDGFDALIEMKDGSKMHPAEVEYALLTEALKLPIPDEEVKMAELSAEIAADIQAGRTEKWSTHLEYEAKRQVLRQLAEKSAVPFLGPTSAMFDIRWHILGQKGIFDKVRASRSVAMMPNRDDMDDAKSFPMDPTRAQLRSRTMIAAAIAGKQLVQNLWDQWRVEDEDNIKVTDPYYTG